MLLCEIKNASISFRRFQAFVVSAFDAHIVIFNLYAMNTFNIRSIYAIFLYILSQQRNVVIEDANSFPKFIAMIVDIP